MGWKQFFVPTKSMDTQEARRYLAENHVSDYTLLDVRQPGEYSQSRIPGSVLIPLPELPGRLDELDRDKPLVVYCAVGGRSRAAAQLLSGKGFREVYNLTGGIKAWQGDVTSGPPDTGMGLITGEETGAEMLAIVYGMEEGMRTLFERLSARVPDREAAELFGTLSELEVHHKQKIFDLYKAHGGELETIEAMDRIASPDVIEGGLSTDELVDAFRPEASSVEDVLSFAMMLETQALDLFLRYLRRSKDFDTKAVLTELAEQEKSHLKYLGQLIDEKSDHS